MLEKTALFPIQQVILIDYLKKISGALDTGHMLLILPVGEFVPGGGHSLGYKLTFV